MARVLFVSYYTPPRQGIATTRTRQLRRYLPAYGWDVTMVTARLDGADEDVVQTPFVDVAQALKRLVGLNGTSTHARFGIAPPAYGERRSFKQSLIALGYRLTSYPDAQIGWLRGRKEIAALIRSGRFDAVLSSSPPFTTDLMLASIRFDIPWIADYRDLWAESHSYASRIRNAADEVLERWTLRRVHAMTTVSEPMANVLRRHRKNLRVDVVPNAFDDAEWAPIPFETETRCTILYAGQLFNGRRDPRPVFAAARRLIDAGSIREDELRIDFYSQDEPWLRQAVEACGLGGVVRILGNVPREDVLRAERRADRLLVLLWSGGNSDGILTGKLFEYLGARRRILAAGGPQSSAVDAILAGASAGSRAMNVDEIARELLAAVQEHRAGTVARLSDEQVAPFSAAVMAQRFAAALDAATGRISAREEALAPVR